MYTQTTFYFKGVNVTDIISDIMIPDIRRPLRPEVTRRKVQIPGRDGSIDFGPGRKLDFNIEVDFTIKANNSSSLMLKMRNLAIFLDGKGELYFTDDTNMKYQAQVSDLITVRKRVFSYVQSGVIVFECDGG